METTPRELRKLKGPQGVQKSTASHSHSHNQDKRMACQACYERKKRCIPAPPYHRCKYCCQENQRCVPRERVNRAVDEGEVKTRKNQIQNTLDSQFPRNAYNLPLPRGIDHEIPRWAAVYSMFAEVMNLIPPEEEDDDDDDDASTENSNTEEDSSTTGDQGDNNAVDSAAPEILNALGLPAQNMATGRSCDFSPLDKDFQIPASGHFHEGFTMYDMDALLRF
ncbi:hypothetical protein N7509_004606 [Penicillium cosmopolitanum]|uniref:Zn(2)-C6 fungal-type domain-containing protein n=1 Tax=Penicillium cosmopolitanum TaxID=1131564 RepID=A0A9W9W0W3_9EURO|nr:uncharacterized protein N7509_004606 [Penicillium cosmopolitanum]KAJ5396493.1 hypothetical protein N7509_004606 [Penicillium cosmopolitanum]